MEAENKAENKDSLCECLFNTLIEMDESCIFKEFKADGSKIYHEIDLKNEIYEDDDDLYEILVLFTNETLEYEGTVYYKIYRQLYESDVYSDFTPLEEYGIYLYTTGITELRNCKNYIGMVDRAIVKESSCPFQLSDIADFVRGANQETYMKIPDILFEDKFL